MSSKVNGKKFVVICGPNMSTDDAFELYDNGGNAKHALVSFPEKNKGAEACRILVHDWVNDSSVDIEMVVFMTRYAMIPNELGGLIAEGKIKKEDAVVHLRTETTWRSFHFNDEGFFEEDWPFGILS